MVDFSNRFRKRKMFRIYYFIYNNFKKEYEVIIAIGNPENWGKQIALYALKSLLLEVFFKWRIEKVIAKIHIENLRSIKLFEHLGFKNSKISNSHIIFSITFDEYFNMLKNN